ncbi:formyl transferase [Hypoxylon sp. NC1633]|nr:formyl transferase [Hypoxylon sp. NC1633]
MAGQQQPPPCRILVMASGNGSNFQALINAVAASSIPNSQIIRLIVNRGKAYATTRADQAGIPWEYFNLISNGFLAKGEKDEEKVAEAREKYDAALATKVLTEGPERPELVVLAGWMHVFSKAFLIPLEAAGIKIINLHPALPGESLRISVSCLFITLLGAFDGTHAIERAHDALKTGTITRAGIMVHYVTLEVDQGAPVMVQEVEWHGEELAQFEEKLHSHEHELIVKATAKVVGEILEERSK